MLFERTSTHIHTYICIYIYICLNIHIFPVYPTFCLVLDGCATIMGPMIVILWYVSSCPRVLGGAWLATVLEQATE